jgi:cellulose 1,4-beta-cellobiosidase
VLAGFGTPPTTKTNNTVVDSLVWVKPGGESDGACGITIDGETAPNAGVSSSPYFNNLTDC